MLYWIIKGGERMNNKVLLVIVVLIVAIGAFTLFGNNKKGPTTSTEKTTNPTVTEPNNPIVDIILTDSGFAPKEITVKAGTTVTWRNSSGKTATVNSNDHPTHRLYPFLNLGEFTGDFAIQAIVEKAGKYSYHNHLNPSETGTITAVE